MMIREAEGHRFRKGATQPKSYDQPKSMQEMRRLEPLHAKGLRLVWSRYVSIK